MLRIGRKWAFWRPSCSDAEFDQNGRAVIPGTRIFGRLRFQWTFGYFNEDFPPCNNGAGFI